MHSLMCLILVFFSILLYLCFIIKRKIYKSFQYFDKHGIPCIKPSSIFGNMDDLLLAKKPINTVYQELYKKLEPHKFGGIYSMSAPMFMLRDPELIKQALIKDFVYFQGRGIPINAEADPLSHHLVNMAGEEWKNLRMQLTSTFTTGKMKLMFPMMKACGEQLVNLLERTKGAFDVKDFGARYGTDLIGICVFGLEIRSLQYPDAKFRDMGRRIFKFRFRTILRYAFPNMSNRLINMFNLKLIDQEVADYFLPIIKNTIKYREDNKITRNDFLGLLITLKNHTTSEKFRDDDKKNIDKFLDQTGGKKYVKKIDMTIESIAAQCMLFFGAGFEGPTSVLSFLMFELARNERIQNKLRDEINLTIHLNGGELTYDCLKNMYYLDMVLAETLRLYPPAGVLTRFCTMDYKIPGTEVIIPKKTYVNVPISGLHSDEKFYEKPNEFYPEHFIEEAKSKRPNFAYLPFGDGPRVCIAERFAKLQIKLAVIHMIKHYSFKLSSEMKLPLKFVNNMGTYQTKSGILLEHQRL